MHVQCPHACRPARVQHGLKLEPSLRIRPLDTAGIRYHGRSLGEVTTAPPAYASRSPR